MKIFGFFVAVSCVASLVACAAFVGPATQGDPFPVKCLDGVSCYWFEECSTGRPHRCIPAYTMSKQDSGAK